MRQFASGAKVVWHHILRHTGVGLVCAVAYFDPGNWGVDLQAGSTYGYKLLFIVLLSGLFALFLQGLACKLGTVTGMDLASHCRLLLYHRTRRPKLIRWLLLYPLYAFSEVAIIATDLAELLGSAIALNILFPRLPLWAGVLLTAADVFVFLIFGDPLRGKPVKVFELVISGLVLVVLICMCIIISKITVHWGDAFLGFVPSRTIFQAGGLYTSVGILGATVMPHSIFLGSALATQDRADVLPPDEKEDIKTIPQSSEPGSSCCSEVPRPADNQAPPKVDQAIEGPPCSTWRSFWLALRGSRYSVDYPDELRDHSERENNSLTFIQAHLRHGIVNLAVSLLGLAVVINSLILILAAAVSRNNSQATDNLFAAADLISSTVGHGAAIVFALALLCAGQSASLVATVAGQIVSEGFLRWHVSPVLRRLLTRLIGLVPSMVVATAVGRNGVDTMLVASQVALSIVLPFVIGPLILLTSSKVVMRVRRTPIPAQDKKSDTMSDANLNSPPRASTTVQDAEHGATGEFIDFSNSWLTIVVAVLIWTVVVVANCYVLVTLILSNGSA
ncbi:natural resistance-associated macrophage protein-domain-containing protein [Vararia minispora EC-137]|uniref:Natural resistance-associated macrophage protein-domain-containing protein n=1 Tax=Vararia minispora EC-137 TaxID=1314806 RepID=A0ACB8QQJ5_9AGAM|nr:natural resistance-associated macrophage protein-domain-containing protein [Vararia minispora EC-137]